MVSTQTEIESQVIELAGKSFKTFCDDISGMFGTDMECSPQAVGTETLKGLQAHFKDLVVVYSVKAEPANPQDALRQGGLNGTFQLVFDQKGLFILAGVVAMHPEQMVLEDAKFGSLEKAERVSGVLKEVGTALAGAWDRVFRKELDGHGRFEQTNIFIGNPWDKSEEKIGLAGDEELVFVPYEMTIGTYPTFKCGVILPKAIFAGTSESGAEQVASAEEKAQVEVEEKAQEKTEEKAQEETESRAPNVSEGVEATEPEEGAATAEKAKPADEETVAADKAAVEGEPEVAADQEQPTAAREEEPEVAADQEPEAAAEQVPEAAAEEKPEAAAEEKPEAAAEQKPEAAVEQEPKAAAEGEPEAAAEQKPEAAAEQEPKAAAEQEPEAAAEQVPEAAAEQVPEAAAEQVPEATKEEEPEATVEQEPEAAAEQEPEAAAEEKPEAAAEQKPEAAKEEEPGAAAEQVPEAAVEQEPEATVEQEPKAAAEQEPEVAADQEPEAAAEQKPNDVEEEATTMAETDKSEEHPVSETIQKMAQSPAALPGEPAPSTMAEKPAISSKDASSTVCAKDIMQKDVIWGNPDDSVQQALTKIQQHDAGYIMIGQGQVPEGVVSKSDLTGALSPYLRSTFAKWRRPLDDATLQIRIKWIMSKPSCAIGPETSLTAIMENMCQAGIRCLPVVDEHGRVQGLVTALDIFKVLLKHSYRK